MLAHPRVGQLVQIWYRAGLRDWMPYHGRRGWVDIRGTGRLRNHLVRVDGVNVVVPCGNMRAVAKESAPRPVRLMK